MSKVLGTKFMGHDSAVCELDFDKKEIFAISTERVTRVKHDFIDVGPVLNKYFQNKSYKAISHGFSNFTLVDTVEETKTYFIYFLKYQHLLRKIFKTKYLRDILNIENNLLLSIKKELNIFNFLSILKLIYYRKKIKILKKGNLAFENKNPEKTKKLYVNFISKKLYSNKIQYDKIEFHDHHLSHAFGSFVYSPYFGKPNVTCLTLDGQGDGFHSKVFLTNSENQLDLIGESKIEFFKNNTAGFVTSLGLLYSLFTSAMDLHPNSDEGKVEALAAYSNFKIDDLYNILTDCIKVDQKKLCFEIDVIKFGNISEINVLKKIRLDYGDEKFCKTIQLFLENIVVEYLNVIFERTKSEYLVLSGGVAANIIMSLNIFERTGFKNIYILPFMGDDGIAFGSAVLSAKDLGLDLSWINKMPMPYFGNSIQKKDIEKSLNRYNDKLIFEYIGHESYKHAALSLSQNKVIANVNGRMEFGPRALGNRSIIANPMDSSVRDKLNSKVKKRPHYQPFCPSILEIERERLFETSFHHKHMATAFRLRDEFKSTIPCATHIDGTARPQFVTEDDNLYFFNLLTEFKKISGFGILINTSFNLHGRTIVHSADDVITDFIDCGIEELYFDGFKITRK